MYKCIAVLLLMSCAAKAQTNGINFCEPDWKLVLQKAKQQHKPIFVDCYASWCMPCREMAAGIFTLQPVGNYFNENFICVQLDMEQQPGIDLKDKYGVSAYPTLLVLNSDGYTLSQAIGAKSADGLLSWAADSYLHKDKITLAQQYDNGNRSSTVLYGYFNQLLQNFQLVEARKKFLSLMHQQGFASILEKKYWNLFALAMPGDAVVNYVINNKAACIKTFGEVNVNAGLATVFTNWARLDSLLMPRPLRQVNTTAYNRYMNKLTALDKIAAAQALPVINFFIECNNANLKEMCVTAAQVADKGTAWQRYSIIKMADAKLYDTSMRNQIAKIFSAGLNTDDDKYAALLKTYLSKLQQPFQDNAIHSASEIIDIGF